MGIASINLGNIGVNKLNLDKYSLFYQHNWRDYNTKRKGKFENKTLAFTQQ